MSEEQADSRLPVTIVSGFKGSGKTTVINRIVNNACGLRFAVILNSAGAPASDICTRDAEVSPTQADVFELNGGCICCSLKGELSDRIRKIADSGNYDYLLVESSCISEPLSVAANFFSEEEDGAGLEEVVRLDTLVTVVDALNFPRDYERSETLVDRQLALDDADDRCVSDVLAEQVEFADVVIVNKSDRVGDAELKHLAAILAYLNPKARLVLTSHGVAALDILLNTRSFDFESASRAAGWQQAINGHELASPDSDLQCFVYRARRPFHPGRLWDALQHHMAGVIRAKGFFWLASRNNHAGVWSQAGQNFRDDFAGRWWASLPHEEWPEEASALEEIERVSEEPYGDRRQELAFIGVQMDAARIRNELDRCLLDEIEMRLGQRGWESFADPFSTWWDDDEGEISGKADFPSA